MNYNLSKAPYIRKNISTDKIMFKLLICLMILFAFGLYNTSRYGMQFVTNGLLMLLVAIAVTLACEFVFALIKKQKPLQYIKNSFGLISAVIIVLTLPANTKLYVIAIITAVGIVVGKLLFGGFGRNFLNPAALARFIALYFFPGVVTMDAITSPTITSRLSILKWLVDNDTLSKVVESYGGLDSVFVGTYFGALGETSTLLILLMGVYLALTEVIDWQVPVTYLGVIFLGSLILGLIKGAGLLYPLVCISTGGVAFAGVFMLTDPVTNPHTKAGKIVFAGLAALITLLIRFFSNYPEGAIISILIVNIITIALDFLFQGKQLDKKKLSIVAVVLSLAIAIFALPAVSSKLDMGSLDARDSSSAVYYKFADKYDDYAAVVEDKGNNLFHVTTYGYGMLPKSSGGMGGSGDYTANEFDIEVVDGKIASIKCIHFGDTKGIGDAAINEDYLADFYGLGIDDEIDAYTGATYTSTSVIAAVAAALQASK